MGIGKGIESPSTNPSFIEVQIRGIVLLRGGSATLNDLLGWHIFAGPSDDRISPGHRHLNEIGSDLADDALPIGSVDAFTVEPFADRVQLDELLRSA